MPGLVPGTFEIEGVGARIVKAGEAICTPPNTPHFGRNATDKESRTIVIRIKVPRSTELWVGQKIEVAPCGRE